MVFRVACSMLPAAACGVLVRSRQFLASAARRAGGRAGAGGGILRCMASNPSARPGSAAGAGSAAALGRGATLITVAPTGAEAGKAAVPALPASLGELVTTAKEC